MNLDIKLNTKEIDVFVCNSKYLKIFNGVPFFKESYKISLILIDGYTNTSSGSVYDVVVRSVSLLRDFNACIFYQNVADFYLKWSRIRCY